MPITRILLLLATLSLGFAAGLAIQARTSRQAPSQSPDQPTAPPSPVERTRLLAQGKEIFMARCASCHDEHGDKPLKSGPPLNERGLSSEKIARLLNGRLRQKTEEERRAVTLYISSLMKTNNLEQNAAAKP
jgi:mono/diheme cytochrome c family protein